MEILPARWAFDGQYNDDDEPLTDDQLLVWSIITEAYIRLATSPWGVWAYVELIFDIDTSMAMSEQDTYIFPTRIEAENWVRHFLSDVLFSVTYLVDQFSGGEDGRFWAYGERGSDPDVYPMALSISMKVIIQVL